MAPATLTRVKRGLGKIWKRLGRSSSTTRRISRTSLAHFCRDVATDEYTLVVHSVDVDHRAYFPNSFVVGKRKDQPANLYTDAYFQDLPLIGTESLGEA